MSYLLDQAVAKIAHLEDLLASDIEAAPKRLASHGSEDRSYKAKIRNIAKLKKDIKALEVKVIEIKNRNKILNDFKVLSAVCETQTKH